MARRPTPQMLADGVELYLIKFHPQVFRIENNRYQELLSPKFTRPVSRHIRGVCSCAIRPVTARRAA